MCRSMQVHIPQKGWVGAQAVATMVAPQVGYQCTETKPLAHDSVG